MILLIGCITVGSLGIGLFLGWYFTGHRYCVQIKHLRALSEKYLMWVRLYDIWMMDDERGRTIENYLIARGSRDVAIYGMSYLGVRLCRRLKQSGIINVEYALDINPQIYLPDVKIYYPGSEKRNVDSVIVTAIYSFDAIKDRLLQSGYKHVYAIDEILYDLLKDNVG